MKPIQKRKLNTIELGHWKGFPPPQYIYGNRKYKGVAINPPSFVPGSWCGAGKALFDRQRDEYLLTSRPRVSKDNKRGYQANIYASDDGINYFHLVESLSKQEVMKITGIDVKSIEGTQLLRDPGTNLWHFYISIDIGEEFVWGGLMWQTVLLTAPKLSGPWKSEGVILNNDQKYDEFQARDGSIDIIDGKYYCIYKAKDKEKNRRPGLATSIDGIHWKKEAALTTDGNDRCAFLSGSLFSASGGPVFIGTEMIDRIDQNVEHENADKHAVKHGGSEVRFIAYKLDLKNLNLETLFRTKWKPSSPFEYQGHPLLGYSSSILDLKNERFLMYMEAIDGTYTKKMGLNHTVERVLVYETKL